MPTWRKICRLRPVSFSFLTETLPVCSPTTERFVDLPVSHSFKYYHQQKEGVYSELTHHQSIHWDFHCQRGCSAFVLGRLEGTLLWGTMKAARSLSVQRRYLLYEHIAFWLLRLKQNPATLNRRARRYGSWSDALFSVAIKSLARFAHDGRN